MSNKLSKEEIIKLFYGDLSYTIEPDFQWKSSVENLGLNPEEYIVEKETMDIVNIYELYNALYEDEVKSLKEIVANYKHKITGSLKLSDYMIAPNNYDFYGQPNNRNEGYYFKIFNKTEWANIDAYQYAKEFAQGDTKQPLATEELIHLHSIYNPIIINEETLSKINNAGLTIFEWERSKIIKSLLKYQEVLNLEIPNHKDILLSENMPKKFTYGQCIVYNKTKDKFCKDAVWLEKKELA